MCSVGKSLMFEEYIKHFTCFHLYMKQFQRSLVLQIMHLSSMRVYMVKEIVTVGQYKCLKTSG